MRGIDLDVPLDGQRPRASSGRPSPEEEGARGGKGTPSDKAPEKPVEKPSGKPAEKPAKKAEEKPPEKAAKKAGEKPPEKAAKKAGEKPAEKPPEKTADETLVSAETESGRGEPVCAYGVEVVELLEMEPIDGAPPWPRRRRPFHRYASAAFFVVFVLGLLNAVAVLLYYPPLLTPDELLGGSCEVSGEVRDVTGAPIPNATIVVTDSSLSAFTNADGWYVLKGVPSGSHRIEAAAVGYGTVSVRVDLRPRLVHAIDFTLERGGSGMAEDISASPDFSAPADSYVWAAPLLLLFSGMALAAALLSLRPERPGRVIVLGVAGALSFGFGLGFVLALVGALLAGMQLRGEPRPPLKKLRVGMPYPSRRAAAAPPPGPVHDIEESEFVHGPPARDADGAPSPGRVAGPGAEVPPAGPGKPGRAAPAPGRAPPAGASPRGTGEAAARADIEEVEVYLKERSLRAKMASAEIEPAATLGRGEVEREGAPRPRRFIRRSSRTKVLCFVCVSEIGQGSEYIRCSCGKTMHVKCLHRPRCPACGCSFRRRE